jgi:23S rRNA (uracil1939-C5)-methyltransferase
MKSRPGQKNRVPQDRGPRERVLVRGVEDSNLRPGKPHHAAPQPVTDRTVLVQIEKPIYGGAFLARDEGKAIFVPLALPGEQVRVRVVEEKRGYATAEIEQLVASAPERIVPGCPHFGSCGGCQYQHAGYETQLCLKEAVLRETLERGGIHVADDITVLAGDPWGYRNRIRLAVDAHGNPGYRGRRSHAVVPIRECNIAAPLLVHAAVAAGEVLKSFAPALRASELALFCNSDETALLLTLFVASPAKVGFDEFAVALRNRIPQLRGAELVFETAHQPPRTLAQWGATSIQYRAAGAEYRVDHGGFFQVNRWMVDALVERVTSGQRGALAWDLFAGVGLFARRLAASFDRVVAVESSPAAIAALESNLPGTTATAVRASTLDFLRRNRTGARPDLVVVDPPRTGLGAEITPLLAEIAPSDLVYVSCDPATLARDLRDLLAAGYGVESIALVDLFPQTFHLETVVRLHRS